MLLLLHSFTPSPISSLPDHFSFLPSSIFHPCFSISAPSIHWISLSVSLSLGRFQGFPRLSYKGKTRLERVDIHSTRVRPTFTMQTWISMVSPNKYHEVSRCWPRRIASLPSLPLSPREKLLWGIRDYGLALWNRAKCLRFIALRGWCR